MGVRRESSERKQSEESDLMVSSLSEFTLGGTKNIEAELELHEGMSNFTSAVVEVKDGEDYYGNDEPEASLDVRVINSDCEIPIDPSDSSSIAVFVRPKRSSGNQSELRAGVNRDEVLIESMEPTGKSEAAETMKAEFDTVGFNAEDIV